ncbi:FAD-dependent oxidoreductase [Cecembia sp.]|uniref:NAD(P)/FAD-dependent oxidoreductase n=1 Tax=Cecembia sp. TaxID=1898110 RepID=UPI0025C4C643|nr:FAD-dependent oxidoreductase [Cecembia sp.]
MDKNHWEIIIIGGGLAGLIAAHQLSKAGKDVLLIEKKQYPFHRVCGEYISNEVRDFLIKENLYPSDIEPAEITKFRLTSVTGRPAEMDLDLGGFGVSRYYLDEFLYNKACSIGTTFLLQTQAEDVSFISQEDIFEVKLQGGDIIYGKHVLGAFGKRSKIDKQFQRDFMKTKSPFIGVKYHVRVEYPQDMVALHNFEGGYCGINRIEEGKFNLCYLGSREQLRAFGNIPEMERQVLHKNPHLKAIFENSDFLFDKPEVINEINFSPKNPVENHVLMIGDAAGLITPLCGNGMAIAIHTGKLAADTILQSRDRLSIEKKYSQLWNNHFKKRLWIGRKVQWLFGSQMVSSLSVNLMRHSEFVAGKIMENTHGTRVT